MLANRRDYTKIYFMDIRIYYEDTDCGGVVYYANYLKYFERGRTEYMEARGIFIPECLKAGFFFVVAHQEIDYKAPAFYADILSVETKVSKVSSASLAFEYAITNKKTAQLIAVGKTVMVCVNKDIQPQKLSQEMREKLLS